jgi:hypothetical protein
MVFVVYYRKKDTLKAQFASETYKFSFFKKVKNVNKAVF